MHLLRNKLIKLSCAVLLCVSISGCVNEGDGGSLVAGSVHVWLSDPADDIWLTRQSGVDFSTLSVSADYTVRIDPSKQYQTMDGFGASMTESSAYLMEKYLDQSKRKEVCENLFSAGGIHITLLRQPMGASDFSLTAWTYDDMNNGKTDEKLENFSLNHEDSYIRPMLTLSYECSPGDLRLIATPWSPPAWMKTGSNLYGNTGGTLNKEYYDTYAEYFVKFLEVYKTAGTPVYAVTVQNEPEYAAPYPGMVMSASEQIAFINVLADKLACSDVSSTLILAYDHNYNSLSYAETVLNTETSNAAGTAFHYYSSDLSHSNLTALHTAYPDKGIWATECGTGTWIGSGTAAGMFLDIMMHTIRFPRNYAKSYITWNVALNQNGVPKLDSTSSTNIGLVTIRSDVKNSVTYTNSYYGLGHTSKFVSSGAVRIYSDSGSEAASGSTSTSDRIETCAYKNTDDSIVLVLLNSHKAAKKIKVKYDEEWFVYTVPGQSAVTFVW
jgi:glucosylceramidase